MKKIINLFITGAIMLLTVTVSCHKSDVKKIGCGCNSDSIWHYVAYDNFGGYNNYNATMGYDTVFKRNAWFIGVTIPNTNYNASLKICNPEYVSVKAITDTIPKKNGIPVRGVSIVFSGKIKRLCSNENQCFGCDAYLPEILFGYLIIDSIKLAD